ncbi:DUF6471 domain-containing protein [Bradyrhizobium genosp. P]
MAMTKRRLLLKPHDVEVVETNYHIVSCDDGRDRRPAAPLNRVSPLYPILHLARLLATHWREWGQRASAFLKSEMKKADVTYAELVKRLKKHGLKEETEAGITMKLKRGSFTAIFFLACVAALELEQVVLEEI